MNVFDHSTLASRPPTTRLEAENGCSCILCDIAQQTIEIGFGRGRGILKRTPGRPSSSMRNLPFSSKKALKLCPDCLSILGSGKLHSCNSTSRVNNLTSLATVSTNKKVTEQLVSNIIDHNIIQDGEAASTSLQLCRTRGPPLAIALKPEAPKTSNVILAEDLSLMKQNLNLSVWKTNILAKTLRSSTGGASLVANIREKIFDIDHQFDDHFFLTRKSFVNLKQDKILDQPEKYVVLCNNVDNLIDVILDQRYHNMSTENILLKVCLDGGGGFMKICLSVIQMDEEIKASSEQPLKDSGVKKLFILAIVPGLQENYSNIKSLWIDLNLHLLQREFSVATDLKLCNILLGLMAHGCQHPCCWCDCSKDQLFLRGTTRTLGSLSQHFWEYYKSGCSKASAKHHMNVIHLPLIKGKDDSPVIHHIPPPELHLLTGPVSTLYNALNNIWPQ